MPRQYFINNFATTLVADCSAVATSIWIAGSQAQFLYDAMAGTGDYVLLTLYSVANGNTEVIKVDRLALGETSPGVMSGEMDTTQGVSSRAFEDISGVSAVAKAFVVGDAVALRPTAVMLTALAAAEVTVAASAAAAAASATAAGLSEVAAGASETAAGLSETAAGVSAAAAAVSATNAAASANNLGAWSLLTGAVSPPTTVVHAGVSWVLLQALANVTTVEPGTNAAYWVVSSNVVSGTVAVIATNITFTIDTGFAANDFDLFFTGASGVGDKLIGGYLSWMSWTNNDSRRGGLVFNAAPTGWPSAPVNPGEVNLRVITSAGTNTDFHWTAIRRPA